YYLGLAEEGDGDIEAAKAHFTKSLSLNARKLGALNALSRIAYLQKDQQALTSIEASIRPLDPEAADEIASKLTQLTQSK
ncbi:MAG: serine protease, partial [Methylophilaceae bacterium]